MPAPHDTCANPSCTSSCDRQRRRWIVALGLIPAAGAVASALLSPQNRPNAPSGPDENAQAGEYHETEHIRKYYRTVRMM